LSKKIVIIYDTPVDLFLANKLLDENFASQYPGASLWTKVHNKVKENNWDMVAADVFLENPSRYDEALLISDMFSPRTQKLINMGVKPCVCFSGESPNVAWKFYKEMLSNTYGFSAYYLFRGVVDYLPKDVNSLPFYWPNATVKPFQKLSWENKSLLVLVASNKGRYQTSAGGFLTSFLKMVMWQVMSYLNPIFQFEDLYQKRIDVIKHFSSIEGFDLFGRGWDSKKTLKRKEFEAVKKCYHGAIDEKYKVMNNYKFSICFENCVFPGYVTEKIFDCFISKTIPIYMGAPDIAEFIPTDTYVDYRNFNTLHELELYLKSMSNDEAEQYFNAAERFLGSSKYKKFSDDYLAMQFVKDVNCFL